MNFFSFFTILKACNCTAVNNMVLEELYKAADLLKNSNNYLAKNTSLINDFENQEKSSQSINSLFINKEKKIKLNLIATKTSSNKLRNLLICNFLNHNELPVNNESLDMLYSSSYIINSIHDFNTKFSFNSDSTNYKIKETCFNSIFKNSVCQNNEAFQSVHTFIFKFSQKLIKNQKVNFSDSKSKNEFFNFFIENKNLFCKTLNALPHLVQFITGEIKLLENGTTGNYVANNKFDYYFKLCEGKAQNHRREVFNYEVNYLCDLVNKIIIFQKYITDVIGFDKLLNFAFTSYKDFYHELHKDFITEKEKVLYVFNEVAQNSNLTVVDKIYINELFHLTLNVLAYLENTINIIGNYFVIKSKRKNYKIQCYEIKNDNKIIKEYLPITLFQEYLKSLCILSSYNFIVKK